MSDGVRTRVRAAQRRGAVAAASQLASTSTRSASVGAQSQSTSRRNTAHSQARAAQASGRSRRQRVRGCSSQLASHPIFLTSFPLQGDITCPSGGSGIGCHVCRPQGPCTSHGGTPRAAREVMTSRVRGGPWAVRERQYVSVT